MQFENYDYTQPFKAKPDIYDGMVVYDKQFGVKNETDERYEAGMNLGSPETAPIRICALGHEGIGLSSFILKAVYNEYSSEPWQNNLLSWDTHQFEYRYEDETVRISFTDLKGFDSSLNKTEMNDRIQKAIEYSNVFLFVYAINDTQTLNGDYSIDDIKKYFDIHLHRLKERKIVLLIGTKSDLENERQISVEKGQSFANKCGEIPFFEISNANGSNIGAVMDQICDIFKYDSDSANYPHKFDENMENESVHQTQSEHESEQKSEEITENNSNGAYEYEHNDTEQLFMGDRQTFSPHCCCCGWVEHCLLNYEFCANICGFTFYVPFMLVLYLFWLFQIPLTLMLNLVAFLLCCDFCKCECCRGSLFIADDESVPNAHNGVMLHTAQSIKDLHLNNNSPKQLLISDHGNESNDRESKAQTISILQWNIFGQLGRYWKRYPLLTATVSELSPDILCLQETVTSKWWRFGTVNTLKKIDPKYRGFHVSAYNVLHDYNKLFFQYSFCWRAINECQSCLNLYCLVPFWRERFWKYSLHSNLCCTCLFNTFNGVIAQVGNAIAFKHNYQLFRSYIPLQPGNRRMALRALYIFKDTNTKNELSKSYGQRLSITIRKDSKTDKIEKKQRRKIWIVCTQLSPTVSESDSRAEQQIQQIISWMDNAQNKICKADAIVICGDFNCGPQSNIYKIMTQNGYESCVKKKLGKEQWTFPTETWKYQRNAKGNDSSEARMTKDYIWIKNINCTVRIEKVRLIGREYKDSTHKGQPIKIYPSDHLGIYAQLSI